MNTKHILNVAGQLISGLSEIQENVYKGTLKVADRSAGVYYFDLNNTLLDDFDSYQERLLADEFYSEPGSMQWNYYLFMLNDQLGPAAKAAIEKNDKYARKFVLTEDEFTDFFTIEKSEAKIRPNIVSDWKRRLDQAGLADVYGTLSYVNLVERFRKQDDTLPAKSKTGRIDEETDKITFIDRLKLKDNYRPYPLRRDYTFGRVNLFRGINGVGKTSLFEAIEAIICGRCLRNPSVIMPQGCLEAEFNHTGKLTSYDGRNTRLYLARDSNWYATNSRNNTLYNSFNRFNFFNADAAHQFSTATTEKEASEALFSIILGPEYHHISERCVGTLERIRPEFNRLREDMKTAYKNRARLDTAIGNYQEPKSIATLRNAVVSAFENLKFKSSVINEDIASIEEKNNELRGVLETISIQDNLPSTLAEFEIQLSDFEKKKLLFNEKEEELHKITERQTNLIAKSKQQDSSRDFLLRCITYIQDERLMQLENFSKRETEATLRSSKIAFAKDVLSNVDPSRISSDIVLTEVKKRIDALNELIKKEESELNELISSYSRLDGIVKQIKSYGRDYLNLNLEACDCPLCQANYDRKHLEERISLELNLLPNNNSTELSILRTRIEQARQSVKEHEAITEDCRRITQAFSTTFSGEIQSDFHIALNRLNKFISEENQCQDELRLLNEISQHAERAGASEKEYQELKFVFEQNYKNNASFQIGNLFVFEELLNNTLSSLNESKKHLEILDNQRLRTGNELKALLGLEGETVYMRDLKAIFQKEEQNIRSLQRGFDNLQALLDVEKDSSISESIELSQILQNNIVSLREEQKMQFEHEKGLREFMEVNKFISNNSDRLQRFERAVHTLRMLTGDEAAAHVTVFFEENFKEIIDIFKAIHVPKEFKTLQYVNSRLELVAENDAIRFISQISTGQRSALALSIFLSLNGKLMNGPDIIMFDDPVAFIDDLNALSFLDYLRIYTLKSGKQIFFATANMRLAGLFDKKFGFLGETDFKKFDFSRNQFDQEDGFKLN